MAGCYTPQSPEAPLDGAHDPDGGVPGMDAVVSSPPGICFHDDFSTGFDEQTAWVRVEDHGTLSVSSSHLEMTPGEGTTTNGEEVATQARFPYQAKDGFLRATAEILPLDSKSTDEVVHVQVVSGANGTDEGAELGLYTDGIKTYLDAGTLLAGDQLAVNYGAKGNTYATAMRFFRVTIADAVAKLEISTDGSVFETVATSDQPMQLGDYQLHLEARVVSSSPTTSAGGFGTVIVEGTGCTP